MSSDSVIQFLDANKIDYLLLKHPPVYTVEEARQHRRGMEDATHAKNLFLKDKKRNIYYLFTAEADSTVKLNDIRKMIRAKHLSFASPEELHQFLELEPGSVSPFGLINDTDHSVIFLVDRLIWEAQTVAFHPNLNSQTVVLSGTDFQRIIRLLGYEAKVLTI